MATQTATEDRTEDLALFAGDTGRRPCDSSTKDTRVWTKDPHGGAYKVSEKKTDPLTEQRERTLRRQQVFATLVGRLLFYGPHRYNAADGLGEWGRRGSHCNLLRSHVFA